MSYFQLLNFWNSAAVNILDVLLVHVHTFPLGIFLGVELLVHSVDMFNSNSTAKKFSKVILSVFTWHQAVYESAYLLTLGLDILSKCGYSNGCIRV